MRRRRFFQTLAAAPAASALLGQQPPPAPAAPPLEEAWTYLPPADPLAHFLVGAKADVRTATVNSREYNTAAASGGGRRMGGTGLYWYPID